jgi:hypothetical protein
MSRLGHERYGVQGGDAGSAIAPWLGRLAPTHVAGVHTNALVQLPSMLSMVLAPILSSKAEKKRLALFKHYFQEMMGYAQIQGTRPKTLTYGLNDSPIGQLAWIVEKFKEWVDPSATLPEDAVARDHILTNVSVLLVHRHRRFVGESLLRDAARPRSEEETPQEPGPDGCPRLEGGRHDSPLGRARKQHRPLDRARARRPLRGARSARGLRARRPDVFPRNLVRERDALEPIPDRMV